jgi:signal transduction histidine kinase
VRRPSLRAYLFAIVAVTTAVFLTVGAYASAHSYSEARRAASRDVAFQARLAAKEMADSLALVSPVVAGSAPKMGPIFATPEGCTLSFAGSGSFPTAHLDVVRPDGVVVCSSLAPKGAPAGASHAGEPWLTHQPDPSGLVTEPAFDRPTEKRALVVAAPVPGTAGSKAGWLAAVLGLDGVAPSLAKTYGSRQGYEFLLTDESGTVLSSSTAAASPATFSNGRLYRVESLPQFGWRLWAGVRTGTALAPARAEVRRRVGLLAATLLAMVLMAAVVNRRIVRPVRGLTETVLAAGAGRTQPAAVQGPRELARLASEFNAMLEHREKAEAKLVDLNARLQEALVQLTRAREDERRAIATALHDDAVQNLTAALWRLDDVAQRGDDSQQRIRGVDGTRTAVEAALVSMRSLLLELHPPALDEAGLAAAVGQLLDGLRADTGAEVELDEALGDVQLSQDVETLAFRTIQEALRNVRKHARASRIVVRLRPEGGQLLASVCDDGVGIDPAELERRAGAGHLGVRSMREQIFLMGGEFSIGPGPEGGAEVRFSLPLTVVDVRA